MKGKLKSNAGNPIDITPKLWGYVERNRLELYTEHNGCVAVLRRRDIKRLLNLLPSSVKGAASAPR